MTNLEKGIARLTDEQRAELWNSALTRNPDHDHSAGRASAEDRPPADEPSPRRKARRDGDDEDQDFSQNTYAE